MQETLSASLWEKKVHKMPKVANCGLVVSCSDVVDIGKKFERRKTSPKPYDDYVNDDASGAITQCQGRLMFPWPSLWEVRFFFFFK